MKVFAVGKIEIQNSSGEGKLLLTKLYKKKEAANKHRQTIVNTYYSIRPFLCPYIVKIINI